MGSSQAENNSGFNSKLNKITEIDLASWAQYLNLVATNSTNATDKTPQNCAASFCIPPPH